MKSTAKNSIGLESWPAILSRPALKNLVISGMAGSLPQWLACRYAREYGEFLFWIAANAAEAERIAADLRFFLPHGVIHFPGHDSLPFLPIAPSPDTMSRRIAALYALTERSAPCVVVTDAATLLEPVIPPSYLADSVEYVMTGEDIDRDGLLQWFVNAGYEHVSIVQARGEFCVRGGLVDFFPPGTSQAVRLDFFGDTVEEIRYFDPLTQRSSGSAEELTILPAAELLWREDLVEHAGKRVVEAASDFGWSAKRIHSLLNRIAERRVAEAHRALYPFFYKNPATLLNYLPEDTLVVISQPESVTGGMHDYCEKARDAWISARESSLVLCELEDVVLDPEDIFSRMQHLRRWYFTDALSRHRENIFPMLPAGKDAEQVEVECSLPDLPVISRRLSKGEGLLGPSFERLASWREQGRTVCLVCPGSRHAARMVEMMADYQPSVPVSSTGKEDERAFLHNLEIDPVKPGIYVFSGTLSAGFSLADGSFTVVTEDELLGTSARRARRMKRRRSRDAVTFEDLKAGQPVVHLDHGIALYQGMVRMDAGGTPGEFLVLEYQKGDRLYLPVDRLALIQRYTGVEGREPRIDKLGGSTWHARQQKVKQSIARIAHDLVDLYAARKVRQGIAFSPPGQMFRQFEAEFPFEETRDQAAAIEEILSDMQAPSPMDRLLCGDVGYGKTEVAMRAAFKAVEDGYQVAVLVPTTLLAEQHERTFRRRFKRFPVNVAAMSRLKAKREQREILEKVRQGKVDILIGTHRLLQSDVQFRNIGLLVVDEEHRFGVKHKEKLKNLRQNMDSLALTATPIPRTLQLSMLGIRDLSTINTPPADRLPVKTWLAEYENTLVRTAIETEIARGGQIFFVHNRVKGIHTVADNLRRLCAEARFAVAHGQMSPAELEKVMIAFVRGEVDCLVCTTIIESGIDIPAANTMIINRADRLGLADMYQLRGRVGRGSEQAYAYLLVSSIDDLSRDAAKRLRAIMDFSTSGGGFRLAMQDLQIRGAGNILGVSQSGQIADVGYDMYLDLLQRAVEELKGMPVTDELDPEVNLRIPAFIPEEYIPDPGQRLEIYRRMSRARDSEEQEAMREELLDRFGEFPPEVINLLAVMEIKELLRPLNVVRLDTGTAKGADRMIMTFHQDGPPSPDKIIREASARKKWSFLPDSRLVVELAPWDNDVQMTENIKRGLRTVLEAAKN
jgi:transcription-repair coupling factor (superfamily II helicase)